jgi:hypothetical protein
MTYRIVFEKNWAGSRLTNRDFFYRGSIYKVPGNISEKMAERAIKHGVAKRLVEAIAKPQTPEAAPAPIVAPVEKKARPARRKRPAPENKALGASSENK